MFSFLKNRNFTGPSPLYLFKFKESVFWKLNTEVKKANKTQHFKQYTTFFSAFPKITDAIKEY